MQEWLQHTLPQSGAAGSAGGTARSRDSRSSHRCQGTWGGQACAPGPPLRRHRGSRAAAGVALGSSDPVRGAGVRQVFSLLSREMWETHKGSKPFGGRGWK